MKNKLLFTLSSLTLAATFSVVNSDSVIRKEITSISVSSNEMFSFAYEDGHYYSKDGLFSNFTNVDLRAAEPIDVNVEATQRLTTIINDWLAQLSLLGIDTTSYETELVDADLSGLENLYNDILSSYINSLDTINSTTDTFLELHLSSIISAWLEDLSEAGYDIADYETILADANTVELLALYDTLQSEYSDIAILPELNTSTRAVDRVITNINAILINLTEQGIDVSAYEANLVDNTDLDSLLALLDELTTTYVDVLPTNESARNDIQIDRLTSSIENLLIQLTDAGITTTDYEISLSVIEDLDALQTLYDEITSTYSDILDTNPRLSQDDVQIERLTSIIQDWLSQISTAGYDTSTYETSLTTATDIESLELLHDTLSTTYPEILSQEPNPSAGEFSNPDAGTSDAAGSRPEDSGIQQKPTTTGKRN